MRGWFILLAACAGPANPTDIIDTSGAPFGWRCNESGTDCVPTIVAGTPPVAPCVSGTAYYSWSVGRFVDILSVCSNSIGWSSSANLDRPVACAATTDCPQFLFSDGPERYECRDGFCQNANTTLFPPTFITWDVAETLCYATFARQDTLTLASPITQQVSDWVNSVCPPPTMQGAACTLPLPGACLQP